MSGLNGNINYADFLLPPDEEVTLPSGMKATLRHPTMRYFMAIASLPNRLTRVAREGVSGEEIAKMDREDAVVRVSSEPVTSEQVDVTEANFYALACDVFIKPQFAVVANADPTKEPFHPSRIRIEDRTWLLQWSVGRLKSSTRGGSADLESFRTEPGASTSPDSGSEVVGKATG